MAMGQGRVAYLYLSKKMIPLILFFVCFLAYSDILFSLPVQIFPEFFFYPWLVSKGLIQYKDFFDHHGFLTNVLLSPLAHNSTILSYIFIATQLIQFTIVACLIHKKLNDRSSYILFLIFYLAFQFAVVQQQMWFDAWMAFFLVVAWFLFEKKREYKGWFFVVLATMIKPTAFLFLIPFFLHSKNKKSILIVPVLWFLAFFYFWERGAMGGLWRQLILFNYSYIQSTYSTLFIGISMKLLLCIGLGFSSILFFSLRKKTKSTPLILMTVIGALFFLQGFSKVNLTVFVPFFVLLIVDTVDKKWNKLIMIITLSLTIIFFRDALQSYKDIQKKQIYLSPRVRAEIKAMTPLLINKKNKNILVVGNRVEVYYLLDVLPSEFSPLHFPWVDRTYPPRTTLSGIEYIIVPRKFNEYEVIQTKIKQELQESYIIIGTTASYTIWRYNKR